MLYQKTSEANLFQELVQNGNNMMSMHDENGIFTYVNDVSFDILGYKPEELIGKSIYEFFHPDELNYHGVEIKSKIDAGAQSIPTFSRFRKKNGDYVWFQSVLSIIRNDKNEITEILNSGFDITPWVELREQMQEKETILHEAGQLAKVGAWKLTFDNNKVYWSPSVYEIHDWEGLEPPSYEEVISMYHEKEKLSSLVQKSIEEGTGYDVTMALTSAKGTVKWMRTVAKCILEGGEVVGLFGVIQDVTSEKIKENALTDSLAKLKARTQRLEDFNHIVSHNLRSPVANMTTLIDLLRESEGEEQKDTILGHLESTANNLQEQLNELMDVVDIIHGYGQTIEEISIQDAIDLACNSLNGEIIKQGAKVTMNLEWDTIKYSKQYLDSILLNLVSNAIKYSSDERQPEIKISTMFVDGCRTLFVEDNGLGIDLETNGSRLFKLRSQVHRERKGNGVGLFFIKEQIEALGGEITVQSEVNKGSVFKVCFND